MEETFWAIRRLFESLGSGMKPLLVVIDDIQWAEPLFLDLLEHLVEWVPVGCRLGAPVPRPSGAAGGPVDR